MIDRYSLFYMIPFFIGMIAVNLIGKDTLAAYGMLAVWSGAPYSIPLDGADPFFRHVLIVRIKEAVWLLLFDRVISAKVVMRAGIVVWCFLGGGFLAMAVMERGIYGIVLFVAITLPQWLCYLAAITLYGKGKRYPAYLCAVGLLLLGCVIEGFVSPNILKKFF